MDPKEIKALVKTLRGLGVTHYKTEEIELTLSSDAPTKRIRNAKLSPEKEKEIKHKIEEMTSLMKMSDDDLVNRLFPDHQQQDEADIELYS